MNAARHRFSALKNVIDEQVVAQELSAFSNRSQPKSLRLRHFNGADVLRCHNHIIKPNAIDVAG